MNHIYRLVWCRSRRIMVVASELASVHRGSGSGGSGKVDRRTVALVPRLLLAALVGAGGMAFASAASAQSSGDPKLDDLQSLIAKYDAPRAAATPVDATVANGAVKADASGEAVADASSLPRATKRGAPVRHEPLVAAKSSTGGKNAASSSANASMSEASDPGVSEAFLKKGSRSSVAIAASGPGEWQAGYHGVTEVADRQRIQIGGRASAQQSSTAKNDTDPQGADSESLASAVPSTRRPVADSVLDAGGATSVQAPPHSRAITAAAPTPSSPAAVVVNTSVVRVEAANKENPFLSTASESTADTAVPLSPKAPTTIAIPEAMDKARVANASATRSTALPTTAIAAVPPPAEDRLTGASTSDAVAATTPLASGAADRRVEHATKAKATSSATVSGLAADEADSADNTPVAAATNESMLAFAPLNALSAGTSGTLLPSLNLSAGLSGSITAAVPVFPTPSNSPTGLIVGNGGAVGTTTQLLGSSTNSLFAGGNGYVTNGSLQVNNANFSQGYSIVSVLGIPTLTLNAVGTLLTSTSGAVVGGTGLNSHLTLLGGVTSDSYIYNINNGFQNALLGIALPNQAPAFASSCLNAVVAAVPCYGINAAQDYQVLVGDGAKANGSKEVVIGTNASHTLPLVNANTAFPGNGPNDPNNPTGVPTADYEARLGHSVVVGDNASGTANAQVILGAEASANVANSVALGYQSIANRGAMTNYTAYGLTPLQRSAGEVSIGSPGQERQITNVAAGSANTDAVNVAQLKGVVAADTSNSVQYDNAGKTSITLAGTPSTDGGATNGTTVTNLHQGNLSATSTDAVNGAQLYATNNAVNNIYDTTSKYFQANSSGSASSATGADSLAAGPGAVSQANTSIAMGSGATTAAGSDNAIAIGTGANANFANSIALGSGSATTVGALTGYTAYGLSAPQNSAGELNIGNRQITGVAAGNADTDAVNLEQLKGVATIATNAVQYDDAGKTSITLAGTPSTDGGATNGTTVTNLHQGNLSATSTDAVNGAQLYATNSTVNNIYDTTSKYFQANSSGSASSATGADSLAAGPGAVSQANTSIAMGSGATTAAGSDNAIAIGTGANANFANSIALGSGSATTIGALTGYTAYGLSAPQTSAGELNIGNRQITGVAAGKAATDAVNVAQLEGVSADAANAVQYDNPTRTSVTLAGLVSTDGGMTNGTTLSNLHQGMLSAMSTDAVNGSQLWHWTQDSTNQYSNYSLYDQINKNPGIRYYAVQSVLPGSTANGLDAAAAGPNAQADGTSSFAMGVSAYAQGDNSLAISDNTQAMGAGSIAIGSGAIANFANSIALGAGSVTMVGAQTNYKAYGLSAPQTSAGELNIGNRQITGVAAGSSMDDAVNLAQLQAVASQIGGGAANNGFAVLYDTDATGNPTNVVTLTGDGSGKPVTITNLAAGAETAASTDAVNGGQLYHWTQDSSNIYSNLSLYNDIAALGQGGGSSNKYLQVNSTAGGATAGGSNSVALGPTASAAGANSVAVGIGASAAADNSVALGSGSVATRANTVSVGAVGSERQITNVAAGTADTDAANVGQVNAGVQQAENWAAGYTDQKFGALSSQIQQIGNRANAGVAAAMAMAGLPQAYEPGKSMAAVAAGSFRSESSIAVGVSTISEGGRWVYKLTGSVDTRGDGGVSIGAGMQW